MSAEIFVDLQERIRRHFEMINQDIVDSMRTYLIVNEGGDNWKNIEDLHEPKFYNGIDALYDYTNDDIIDLIRPLLESDRTRLAWLEKVSSSVHAE